jgi:hypothetical protein
LIDVPSNIDGPPNRERGMMFRRQIYDAHRHCTLPIEKSLIEREMIPNRLPVRSPR